MRFFYNCLRNIYSLDIDSLNSSSPFSPLHASSPSNQKPIRASRLSTRSDTASSVSNGSRTNSYNHMNNLPQKQSNFRLLTVNCCSIREHKQEFVAALDYVKPDIICGTESWLKGVKPGREPSKGAIKTCEIFYYNMIFITRVGTLLRESVVCVAGETGVVR